ncbi:biotin/lipoyl-binding protein, partial [bacterium]|nr:biotin/lipoyl-binding protein [bacterium]
MDIQRTDAKRNRIIRRILFIALTVIVIASVTAALSNLKPALPSVERAAIWVDTVKRGNVVREVRGPGNLVPMNIRWVSPDTSGRVEEILIQPGAVVTRDTVIMQLSNPELLLNLEDAKLKVKSAES